MDSLRTRLVDVGADLVRTAGPGALGLREIARRAGVSHGAPRRYFPTHQALLSEIARRGFAELAAKFAAAADDTAPPRAQLSAWARAYVRYARECPGMFELMFRHDLLRGEADAAGAPRLRESSLPLFARLVELVARYRPAAAVELTAVALWTNVHGIAQLAAWGAIGLALGDDDPARTDDQADQLVAVALATYLGEA